MTLDELLYIIANDTLITIVEDTDERKHIVEKWEALTAYVNLTGDILDRNVVLMTAKGNCLYILIEK